MDFNMYVPTKILFGAGTLNELGKQQLPGKKAVIIISNGKSTRANGYLSRTEEQLAQAGVATSVFDKIQPNPLKETVMEGAAFVKAQDADFIVALGGGGGYTLNAAKSDKRFKAVATLSMFNSGEVRRNGYMNSGLDTVQQRLHEASDARAVEITKGEYPISGNVDFDALSDEDIAKIPTDLYREGMMYYGRTHRHPNSTFAYTTSSLMELMAWDATDQLELIDQPLLLMAGSKADSLYMSKEAFEKAIGTKDKELFLVDGATHIQTYYVPEYVDQFVAKLQDFYGKHL